MPVGGKRNRALLSDDEDDDSFEVKIIDPPPQRKKSQIVLDDEEENAEKEDDRNQTNYFQEEEDLEVKKVPGKKRRKVISESEDEEAPIRQSARRQAVSSKRDKQRKAAEDELKRLYNQGLDAVLEDDQDDEYTYAEEDGDEDEDYGGEEEEEKDKPARKSLSKKTAGKRALEAFNDRAFSKGKDRYSNYTVARCLKDYERDEPAYDFASDLDDFIVDDDEEELVAVDGSEEESDSDNKDQRRKKGKAIKGISSPKGERQERSSTKTKKRQVEKPDDENEDTDDNQVLKTPKRKSKGKLDSSSEDEEEEQCEDDEEEEEESVDGNLLYWRFNQMRESKEQEEEDVSQILGIRKSFPLPEAIGYYIEYLGKCLISKSFMRDQAMKSSSKYLSAARQIENLICTHRESLLGSSAWRQDFLKELQSRPFFMSQKQHSANYFHDCEEGALYGGEQEKCQACGRGSHAPDHRLSLFGPSYNALKIWEGHWINCIPKALLLHSNRSGGEFLSSQLKTPTHSLSYPSPSTGVTTSSTNRSNHEDDDNLVMTSNGSRQGSRNKQFQAFQSCTNPPDSHTKRKLLLTPPFRSGKEGTSSTSSHLQKTASISKGRSPVKEGIASLQKPEVNRSSPTVPPTSTKKKNSHTLLLSDSDGEERQNATALPVDLTEEDDQILVSEVRKPFPEDSSSSPHHSSGTDTDSDNDKRNNSKTKKRMKLDWWQRQLPKLLNYEAESSWHLSLHCKLRTQLYHTLLHYKFRLLLKLYEYLDSINEINCELSDLTSEELVVLYEEMIHDHNFIQQEVQRFQALINTTGKKWGGERFESQTYVWRNDEQIYRRREKMFQEQKKKKKKKASKISESGDEKRSEESEEVGSEEEDAGRKEGVERGGKGQLSFATKRMYQPQYQSTMTDFFYSETPNYELLLNRTAKMSEALETISPEFANKSIFIFTSSGKPIFTRVGNEEDMVTTFGFLQAVVSIVLASGDVMKCILAGDRRIVFLLKQSIYFVSVSSTHEPECILLKQLDFLYQKILFILTIKVHSILENNPATDLRSLLGSDSDRILRTACTSDYVPIPVAFHALPTMTIEKSLREDLFSHLKVAVESSKAAMGLMMYEETVFAMQSNPSIDLSIGTGDAILLANFISKSTIFKSQDQQYWVPICLPGFNAQGYLQAYVSTINIRDAKDGMENITMFMVLIAVSNDPESFKDLIQGKQYMEKAARLPEINTRLLVELSSGSSNTNKIRDTFDCLHFFYKMCPIQKKGSENKIGISQYIVSDRKFPLNFTGELESIMIEYQKLALRLRRGTIQWESTLFPPPDVIVENKRSSLQNIMRSRKASARYSPTFTKGDNTIANADTSGKSNEGVETSAAFEDGINIMSSLPSADHQLVSAITNSGIVYIGLASYDCELFLAFPPTYGVVEASERADSMLKYLKSNALAFLCTR